MRGYFAAAAGVALLGAGLCTAPQANAQGKAPLPTPQTKTITPVQFSEMQGGTTQANWREGYRHGRFLVLTMKNNDKIGGRVVWTDEKAGVLYLRPQDGEAPIGVSFNDISKAERIQFAAAKPTKGGVVPASIPQGDAGPAALPPDAPEIHVVRIANGDVVTEQFYSNAISPREQSVLKRIEAAEREVAANRQMISELNIMLQNKSQLQDALLQQAQAQTTYLRILNNTARDYHWYGWVYEDAPLGLNFASFPFRPYFNNQFGYNRAPFVPYSAPQYPVVQRIQNEAESFDPGRITENLDIARKSLEKAQADLAMARSHAIYEGGNIVAVRLD